MTDETVSLHQAKVWQTPGGVHPPVNKDRTKDEPTRVMPLLDEYIVPVSQHAGAPGRLHKQVGDSVLKGELLAEAQPGISAAVHAPTSGTISAIKPHVSSHPSGIEEPAIFIQTDGQDTWREQHPVDDFKQLDKQAIVDRILQAGITGLGGASFPTHIKVSTQRQIKTLIINGAECEPYITADDRLMREQSTNVMRGLSILAHLLNPELILIGIEDDKPEAIDIMTNAAVNAHLDASIRVQAIPTRYPSGGEKQLIQILTGKEVPHRGLPADIGILVQNVATVAAIANAVIDDVPLIERIVTVTGESVNTPANLLTRIGTPVAALLQHASFSAHKKSFFGGKHQRLIMGGPMMGFELPSDQIPVVKATNCVIAPGKKELPWSSDEQPCIRCSNCADACPASLLPQQLQWYAKAKDYDNLDKYNLSDCIECGACAFVCPSEIPLVHYYRIAKSEIRVINIEKDKAQKAKIRFDSRQARLEREEQERLEKHRKAAESRKAKTSTGDSKDKIAAALARVQAKKKQDTAETDSSANDANASKQDKVAAAIARARAKKAAQQAGDAATTGNTSETSTAPAAEDDKKARVAAAIARAKAKKEAAQQGESAPSSDEPIAATPATEQPQDDKKARVAAAIARAKAKKAKERGETVTTDTQVDEPPAEAPSAEPLSPEEQKKARIAAAVAKAKAKKAKERGESVTTDTQVDEQPAEALSDEQPSPEEQKKARIAAAVAKAKAKKAKERGEAVTTDTQVDEQPAEAPSAEPLSPEEQKKARIAAAVAKAKAKKAKERGESVTTDTQVDEQPAEDPSAEALSPEEAKKQRIARAVAKAKAKQQARDDNTQG